MGCGAQIVAVEGLGLRVLEMCSGSEAGSYLRIIDFVYHSTLGLRVTKTAPGTGSEAKNASVARISDGWCGSLQKCEAVPRRARS